MHRSSATIWVLFLAFSLIAWLLQVLRWSRVAQGERCRPFAIMSIYRQWAFPASASATAVETSSGMPSRLLESPFRVAGRIYENRAGHAHSYDRSDRRFTKKPISLTLVVGLVMATAIVGRTPVVIYLLAVSYALIFPWGFPLRRRPRPLRHDHTALLLIALSAAFSGLLGIATWAASPLVAAAIVVLAVPLTMSLASAMVRPRVKPHECPEPPIRIGRSSRGATIVTDRQTMTDDHVRETLGGFRAGELSGRRLVITGGLVGRGKDQAVDNYRLGIAISEHEFELVVVGRSNAEALTAGYGVKTRRFDSTRLAMTWVQRELSVGDGALFLGDMPDYYP